MITSLSRRFALAALCASGLLASASQAQTITSPEQRATLVELYTSQGCSSCPPAEVWMSRMTSDPRLWKSLFPINFHVDYWDYLGWPDPYASSVFSQRQKRFRHLGLTRNVATPGFVINGRGWDGWFYGRPVPLADSAAPGKLTAELTASSAAVDYSSTNPLSAPLKLHRVVLGFDIHTPIPSGENAGRTLAHDFVVLDYQQQPMNPKGNSDSIHSATSQLPQIDQLDGSRKALLFWVSQGQDPTPLQVAADWL